MVSKLWQGKEFLQYLLRSFHLHGIHSPFVYQLNEQVFQEKTPYYAFEEIESIRAKLLLTTKSIAVKDLGAGSKTNRKADRKINEIAKTALKSPAKAQLLFRLAHYLKPVTILELGTSLGITTAYLAKALPSSSISTIEGAEEVAKVARINFDKLQLKNIQLIVDNFDDALQQELQKTGKAEFVFFDGNHRKEPTINYFEQCLTYAEENSVFIFDDIYWSAEMKEAWQEIKKNPRVSLSIDLFDLGLVFFKKGQAKEHFTVYHRR
jgi:predicted O-methyltransferase YrrM